MSYIGNQPATAFETVQKQISTSNSGTTITLDRAVTSVQDILLTIDAVVQSYDNYSVSGTTLTVGGTLSNNRVEILYVGRTMQSVDATDDSISAAKIKTDAVTTAKVQNDAITVDKLNLISTSSVPSIEAKGDGSVEGKITWNCENNSHGQTIQASPHSSGQSWTLKLPDNSPTADKFLKVKSITGSGSTATGQLEFADAPSGGLVPVRQSSGTSNTTNVIVNGWITDTYENYVMDYYFNVATNNEAISMTLYDSSGNISSGNEYDWTHIGSQASDGAKLELYNTGQNAFRLCHGANNDSARVSVTGRLIWLHPRASGKRTTLLHHQRQLNSSAVVQSFVGALDFKATNQLTGFYCNSTSGDISEWDINIYGIVNS